MKTLLVMVDFRKLWSVWIISLKKCSFVHVRKSNSYELYTQDARAEMIKEHHDGHPVLDHKLWMFKPLRWMILVNYYSRVNLLTWICIYKVMSKVLVNYWHFLPFFLPFHLNGPFATNGHMVQNPPYWRASSLLFPHWDIKTKASPSAGIIMSLSSSMADFVPCDRLLQKAYYHILLVSSWILKRRVAWDNRVDI